MLESNNLSGVKKEIYERAIRERRDIQYEVLWRWRKGKLTGLQCLEQIIDLEKIIPLNKDIIKGKKQ